MLHYLRELFQALDISSMSAAVLRVAAVFLCLTVHETCHGLAAYALGDPTAKRQHRLSLNPLRHIEWIGLAMMFAAGFGWARPVPVDPRYFKNPQRGMALTALAGPVSNLLLALLLLAVSKALYPLAVTSTGWFFALNFCVSAAILSIGLGVFNLLPIPPLDGAKVFGALLPEHLYFAIMRYERYGMLVLLLISFTGIGGGWVNRVIYAIYQVFSGWLHLPFRLG